MDHPVSNNRISKLIYWVIPVDFGGSATGSV